MAILHLGIQAIEKTVPPTPPEGTIPTGTSPIYVSGAGLVDANGTYTDNGNGTWSNAEMSTILFDTKWYIDVSTVGYAYFNNGGDSSNLPKTGWFATNGSYTPEPTISDTAP